MQEPTKHWTSVQENGTVLGIKILLFIYHIFGRLMFSIILRPVMVYYFLTNRTARDASKEYIENIAPYLSISERAELSTFKHFLQFGNMVLDKLLVWIGKLDESDIIFKTPSVIDDIKVSGKGAIIIVSHLGNIEVCSALRQKLDEVKLTILVNTSHAQKINSLMKQLNSESQAELVQINDLTPATAMMLSDKVDRGEIVVIAGDRTPEHSGRNSKVDFMGKLALMPQGPFILASLLKCPVYLLFCLKQKNKYHIYVEKFAEQVIFPRKNRQQEIDICIQKYATRLQFYCTKAPLQWFNFFPFWLSQCNDDRKVGTKTDTTIDH